MSSDEYSIAIRHKSEIDRDICHKVNEHFLHHGCERLELIEPILMLTDERTVEVYWREQSIGYTPRTRELPLIIAILRDFSLTSLSKIVAHFHIDPVGFILDFEDLTEEVITTLNQNSVDGLSFHARMVEVMMHDDPHAARKQLLANIHNKSILMAFIAQGDCKNAVNELIDDEWEKARRGEPVHDEQPFQSLASGLAIDWSRVDHLPHQSTEVFVIASGGLNPHVLKKTLSRCSYWEDKFAQLEFTYQYSNVQNEATRQTFHDSFVESHEAALRMMLSNLDMSMANDPYDTHESLEHLMAILVKTPLKDVCQKLTFALSFLRNDISPLSTPSTLHDLLNPNGYDDQATRPNINALSAKFSSLGSAFFQTVIDETFSIPDAHVGYHLLSLPAVVSEIDLPEQIVRPGSFEAYLNKLAPIALDYKIENSPPFYKAQMDMELDDGLFHWYQKLSRSNAIDSRLMANNSPEVLDQLVQWGMDVRVISEPSDRSLTLSLERDMGL